MAGGIGVSIQFNHLPRIAGSLRGKASRVVRKTAHDIEAGAKARSREDTGAMKGGWQTEPVSELEAIVYNGVEHVLYNEYGTAHMSAQPMATPAAEAARGPFIDAMRALLD
jgi:hypothetical protein